MTNQEIIKTNIKDCVLLKPKIFNDNRGRFSETYKNQPNSIIECKQINYSYSHKGVIRGIHKTPYAKLITCALGQVFDVCVDLRKDSPTYLEHFGIKLNPESMQQLYIPKNCGHAFYSITESLVVYIQESLYDPNVDETFCYKNYNIPWPDAAQIISEKDSKACL
jgi:dTDP-4-dehydrorhamnose 3,5-epimerase